MMTAWWLARIAMLTLEHIVRASQAADLGISVPVRGSPLFRTAGDDAARPFEALEAVQAHLARLRLQRSAGGATVPDVHEIPAGRKKRR
jgi:hypothetical protein